MLYALAPGSVLAGANEPDGGHAMLLFEGLDRKNPPPPLPLPLDARVGLTRLGNGNAVQNADSRPYGHACGTTRKRVSGLPGGVVLRARTVRVRAAGAGVRVRVDAQLVLPRPDLFASSELTVRVGPLSQAIPAADLTATRKGFRYRDPSGANGWLRRLEYDARRGRLAIDARSAEIALDAIDLEHVVLTVENRDVYAAESFEAQRNGERVTYRAR